MFSCSHPEISCLFQTERNDLNTAYGVFAEARIRHIGIRISAAGPTFEDDEYKYNVSNIAFNLGYSYYF